MWCTFENDSSPQCPASSPVPCSGQYRKSRSCSTRGQPRDSQSTIMDALDLPRPCAVEVGDGRVVCTSHLKSVEPTTKDSTFHILRSAVIRATRSPAVFFTRPSGHSLQQGSQPPGDTRYSTLVPSIFILDRDPFFSMHALPGGEVLSDQQVIFVFLAMNIPGYLCGSRMSMTLAPRFASPLCPPDLGRLGRVLAHHHLLCIARCEIRMMKREPCKMW